jgi:hypothetical protein
MSNYEDLNYYSQRLEDFMVWLAIEKIEFAVRQPNGMLRPVPCGTVLEAYQELREAVFSTRCSQRGSTYNLAELDEVS